MAAKKQSPEQRRLDADLWIIALVTGAAFACYAVLGDRLMAVAMDGGISLAFRLLLSAGMQFAVAGLGMSIVCLIRREPFSRFGLHKAQAARTIAMTALCFLPSVCARILSGQFQGYRPLSIMITDDVLASGLPGALLGMAVIAIVWGFFEGFNYAVISQKINERYPSRRVWLDNGALVCALLCLLVHPLSTSFWGLVEMLTTFFAIYGMLWIKGRTGNAWGCVAAYCLIWNAV